MGDYLDGRLKRTIRKRRDLLHTMSDPSSMQAYWVETEFQTLTALHDMGLQVPRPIARTSRAIAMEFVGMDEAEGAGEAAPRLRDAALTGDEAKATHDALLVAIERMLAADTIHGDLSPYNVLMRSGAPVIIDFPQAIDARYHSQGEAMLARDVLNVRNHFRRWGLGDESESASLAHDLWRRYQDREL